MVTYGHNLLLNYTKNNTFITLTDRFGNVKFVQSGVLNTGFKNSQKSTKVARTYACELAAQKIKRLKVKALSVSYLGKLRWRRLMFKSIKKCKIKVTKIKLEFGVPFNGCKARKKTR